MDSCSTSHHLVCKDSWLKPISLDWVHSESDYPSQHGSDERSTHNMLERGTESSIDLLQGLVAFLFWFRICWSDILEQNWKQSPSAGLAVADQLGQSEAWRKIREEHSFQSLRNAQHAFSKHLVDLNPYLHWSTSPRRSRYTMITSHHGKLGTCKNFHIFKGKTFRPLHQMVPTTRQTMCPQWHYMLDKEISWNEFS